MIFLFLGQPWWRNFPALRVGHWDEVMVCVGGRSVIFCHCHTGSVEKRQSQRCAQLTFMAPPLTVSNTVHTYREKMLSAHFFVQHFRLMRQSGSTSISCFWVRHWGSPTAGLFPSSHGRWSNLIHSSVTLVQHLILSSCQDSSFLQSWEDIIKERRVGA